jgi:dolichol kinase
MPRRTIPVALAFLVVASVVLELSRRQSKAVERGFERVTLGVMRPAEERGILGSTMLMTGYALAWLLFPASAAAPAIMVTAAADPAAATFGPMLSRQRGRKTIAGSLAAAGVAFIVLLLTTPSWIAALVAAIAAALAERLPGAGLDNLAIPLATAAVLVLLT